jgi:hypothetical protein
MIGADTLILAAEPTADSPMRVSEYRSLAQRPAPVAVGRDHLTLYLLRLLAGVLAGGATMLATARWTHLDASLVRDIFLGVLIAVMTLVAASVGFSHGAANGDVTHDRMQ